MTALAPVPTPWLCHGCGRQDAVALVVVEVQLGTGKPRRARYCHTCRVPLAHHEVCTNDPRTCPRAAEHPDLTGTHRTLDRGKTAGNTARRAR